MRLHIDFGGYNINGIHFIDQCVIKYSADLQNKILYASRLNFLQTLSTISIFAI